MRSDTEHHHARRGQEDQVGRPDRHDRDRALEEIGVDNPQVYQDLPTRTRRSRRARSTPCSSTPRSTSVKPPLERQVPRRRAVRTARRPRPVRRDPPEGLGQRRAGQRGVHSAEGLGRAQGARDEGPDRRPRHARRSRSSRCPTTLSDCQRPRLRSHRPAAAAGRCSRFSPASRVAVIGGSSRSPHAAHVGRAPALRPVAADRRPRAADRARSSSSCSGSRRSSFPLRRPGGRAQLARARPRRRRADPRRAHRGRGLPRRPPLRDRVRAHRGIVGFGAFLLPANHGARPSGDVRLGSHLASRTALIRGFWCNIKLFVVTEVIVLVWALLVAVVRQLPGRRSRRCASSRSSTPTCSAAYPPIIVIYLIVLRLPRSPACRAVRQHLSREHAAVLAGGARARARVRRVRRRGVPRRPREHPLEPDRGGPFARALAVADAAPRRHPAGRAPDHPAAPQRLRRAAERHRARVDRRRPRDPRLRASSSRTTYFNLSPVTGAAIFFLVDHDPVHPAVDYLIKRDKERTQAAMSAFLELDDVHKCFGDNEVLQGVDLGVDEHQVVCLIGPSGCGKSTLLRCINALEAIDAARSASMASASPAAASTSTRCGRTSASCSRASTCSRT